MIRNINTIRKIKPSDKLVLQLQEMQKNTALGKLKWDILVSTSEYNETKVKTSLDGEEYSVDECYVSYHTNLLSEEFLLITHELIYSNTQGSKSSNLVFLPPLGIRYFDINALAPYAIEADSVITYQIHALWNIILERKKNGGEEIDIKVEGREVNIDE